MQVRVEVERKDVQKKEEANCTRVHRLERSKSKRKFQQEWNKKLKQAKRKNNNDVAWKEFRLAITWTLPMLKG